MNWLIHPFLIVILICTHLGCAHNTNTKGRSTKKQGAMAPAAELPSNTPTPQVMIPSDPVVWIAGGWNSCKETATDLRPSPWGMNAFKHFAVMYERLKSSRYPKLEYFATCLTPDIRTVKMVNSSDVHEILEIQREAAFSLVAKRAAELNAPIVIIGHSYGGWLTMKAAQTKTEAPIKLLLTMDPISAVTCTAEVMTQIIETKLNYDLFAAPPGCVTSPKDISAAQQNQIRGNVRRWVNLWQRDTFNVLHGSPIDQAENEEVFLDGADAINGHINMGLSESVWQKIQTYVESSL